jgi:hypothetical protein
MTNTVLKPLLSQNTTLTIFVTLFFISFFIFILMRWNKSTDGFSNTEHFAAKPKNSKTAAKLTRTELFQNPEVKSKAQDVFTALEAFSDAKNKAEGIERVKVK